MSRGLTQDPLRADDGIRTRDPHLGKVMLYQLSHVRIAPTEALLRCNARKNLAGVVASCKSASQRSVTEAGVVACSNHPLCLSLAGAIGAVVARFVHTEEVTGSNPVSPTLVTFSLSHPRRVSSCLQHPSEIRLCAMFPHPSMHPTRCRFPTLWLDLPRQHPSQTITTSTIRTSVHASITG